MLHFFRKIRRDLLDNDKFLRYLKYGIGEIILVVIGILIALQVNNWNEERIAAEEGLDAHNGDKVLSLLEIGS